MSQSVVIKGAECVLYLNGKIYAEVQSIQVNTDYGEMEIYGIDSEFAQEIASTKLSVNGSVSGVRVKLTGGLQGYGARALIHEGLQSPYISIRIKDRQNEAVMFWLPQMKITSESFTVAAKGIVVLSFKFKGIVPYHELDMR